ncbi:MAG: 2'-deoxycytidine 5'-triphosphate deaminase [Patescibacteria group bacterium]
MSIEQFKGALAIQHIRELMHADHIREAQEEHLQPSSIDLSVSGEIYRMRGTFLPRPGEKIRDILKNGILFPVSLNQPLELNGIYLIRLNELLDLPSNIYAMTNNKSSSGRINLQTRLIVNSVSSFDYVPRGYNGELWLEVIPKSFPVKLAYAERLNQMRFFTHDPRLSDEELRRFNDQYGFLRGVNKEALPITEAKGHKGLTMSIDLVSEDIIGYRCTPTSSRVLEYSRRDYKPLEFFEPIHQPKDGNLIMRRGEFYIFATKEGIRVPKEFAVEMMAYDVSKGEFRSHYAGFFDPGWGYGTNGETLGTPAVLEVFTHDNDFVLRDGQPICQMVYEHLTAPAEVCYGDARLTNNYYTQHGPRLSKHFKMS